MEQALAWLSRWGVSFASLGGGLLTLLVFRRGLPNVGWIVGYLLLLWLLFAVFIEMRQALAGSERKSRRLIVSAVDYTIQTLYHGLLLFVLPAYYAAATLTSLNGVFLALLVALALPTTLHPWYPGLVQPPAPLFLARAAIAWDVVNMDSLEPAPDTIGADELRLRGLIAYTAIYAPAGLFQPINHVWRREGQVVNVVSLSPVKGGRQEGFRTYSHKTSFPADPTGRWTVDVETSSGQLIGRLRFRVTP